MRSRSRAGMCGNVRLPFRLQAQKDSVVSLPLHDRHVTCRLQAQKDSVVAVLTLQLVGTAAIIAGNLQIFLLVMERHVTVM